VPSAAQARAAAELTGRAPVTAARPRPATGSHRTPPPRSSFSSGQRALLWAAGVLGALAIVIAILIVLNAQDRRDRENQPPPTITTTITETTPYSPTAMAPRPTSPGSHGHAGEQLRVTGHDVLASALSAWEPGFRLLTASEQTPQ
ncbi:serine/threonine protein kinase, partial [Mycolicibacterium pulveris]